MKKQFEEMLKMAENAMKMVGEGYEKGKEGEDAPVTGALSTIIDQIKKVMSAAPEAEAEEEGKGKDGGAAPAGDAPADGMDEEEAEDEMERVIASYKGTPEKKNLLRETLRKALREGREAKATVVDAKHQAILDKILTLPGTGKC